MEEIGEAEWRGGVEGEFFFSFTKAPAVLCGCCSAPSGSLLGGNSNALLEASKEKRISSSQIEDRSCRTGEPAGTGSPARHLQLNEGHLAEFLTICSGYVVSLLRGVSISSGKSEVDQLEVL